MEQTTCKSHSVRLLNAIYQNAKDVCDTLLSILPKVRDERLKNDVTVQISRCDGFATRAAKLLAEEGGKPMERSKLDRMKAGMRVRIAAARDSKPMHLAGMIRSEVQAGARAVLCRIREAEAENVSGEPLRLAKHLCEYEENIAEEMKSYLR